MGSECGEKTRVHNTRVVGGTAARPGDWPWVVALGYTNPQVGALGAVHYGVDMGQVGQIFVCDTLYVFNRTGVAGAVLQTPL